jgi:hypothetical protein
MAKQISRCRKPVVNMRRDVYHDFVCDVLELQFPFEDGDMYTVTWEIQGNEVRQITGGIPPLDSLYILKVVNVPDHDEDSSGT